MIPVLAPSESKRLDVEAGDRLAALMERAGHAVAMAVLRAGFGYGSSAVLLAGPGNNGGDAWVAARHLRRHGVGATVVPFAEPATHLAKDAAAAAIAAGVAVRPWAAPWSADVLVDGLFGVGLSRPLPPEIIPWTDHDGFVVAVDVPSGLDAATGEVPGTAFVADVTVTFHAPKTGLLVGAGPDHTGVIEIADIGLEGGEPELLWWTGADAGVPKRGRRAHKWTSGSVLVVGGAPGMTGAPVLAATAALRAGAGAVSLATPGRLPVSAPSALLRRRVGEAERFGEGDAATILHGASRYDILALGPGLGPDMEDFVNTLADGWQGPLVLDADGITAVDLGVVEGRSHPTVLTPHAGEFFRLTGEAPGHEAAGELAAGIGATVLLKGSPSFVADTSATRLISSGGRELATIGTGDVLTGMVAAFLARGLPPGEAAASATYWHGLAGRHLSERGVLTADDLVGIVGSFVPGV
jgi:hydroxyethylthiazole kinase-like uncharacterized protein yjeF